MCLLETHFLQERLSKVTLLDPDKSSLSVLSRKGILEALLSNRITNLLITIQYWVGPLSTFLL